jgi:hypothetical protein
MFGLILAAAVAAAPAPVSASEAAEGVTLYPSGVFASANPSSALDMIQRLPGFTFQAGDPVRGFAGAAGNVLVDGQRPTSKAVTLDEVLRRIPAESVVRIELIRGGAPGIDMQGQPVIANVVRSTGAVTEGAVAVQNRVDGEGRLSPRAELLLSQRRGALSVAGGLTAYYEVDIPNFGDGTQVRRTPAGALFESGPLTVNARTRGVQATGEAALTRSTDTFRLNGAASRQQYGYFEMIDVLDAAGRPVFEDRSASELTTDKLEIGGDYERVLGAGLTGRVLALQTLTRERRDGLIDLRNQHTEVGELNKIGESIGRATLTKQDWRGLTLEGGGEAAFNFLDAESTRVSGGTPIILPNANVRIEERRGEGFFKVSWRPGPRLAVEFEQRTEYSRISQSGDTNIVRSFFFPKPRLQATISPDPTRQLRLRLEREIGQLNFRDFAASSAIDAGTTNVGNAALEPQRAWVVEAALEQRFWGRGAVVLTYTHSELERVADLIPVNGAFDAPGNIGNGTRDDLALSIAIPLQRLGVPGGLIRGTGTWRRSKVTDPVTGQSRGISGLRPFEGDFHFTQDLPSLRSSWGIDYLPLWRETFYRINEVRTNVKGDFLTVYWEWRPRRDLTVRADATNFTDRSRFRNRTQYAGSRGAGVVSYAERRAWDSGPLYTLRVRKAL